MTQFYPTTPMPLEKVHGIIEEESIFSCARAVRCCYLSSAQYTVIAPIIMGLPFWYVDYYGPF